MGACVPCVMKVDGMSESRSRTQEMSDSSAKPKLKLKKRAVKGDETVSGKRISAQEEVDRRSLA